MKMIMNTACATALLLIVNGAAQAESIDIKVTGTIMPTACTATVANGGTIDYGSISQSQLKKDALTPLDNKQLSFLITCDSPAKVGLKALNGRQGTAAGTTETGNFGGPVPAGIPADNGNYVVGLGLDAGKKTGGYNIAITDVKTDGKTADYLYSYNAGQTWTQHQSSRLYADREMVVAWAEPGLLTPVSFSLLSGTLNVRAYINKLSELDLSKPVKLDGLTTLELVYL